MQFEIDWQNLISVLSGGGALAAFLRFGLARIFEKIDLIQEKLISIESRLNVLDVHITEFNNSRKAVQEHDRKIIELETKIRTVINGKYASR